MHIFAVCDTELFYSVGIYYSEFKVKKNSGSSAAAAERKSGENRTCCGNQLGMILTYAHYSQLLRGVMIIFERLSWWFSVGICKYKLSYKAHDLYRFSALIGSNYSIQTGEKSILFRNIFPSNERTQIHNRSCDL